MNLNFAKYSISLIKFFSNNEILLGSTWMHNHDIIFDNQDKKIGLVSSQCDRANGDLNFNNYNNKYNQKYVNTCDHYNTIRFYKLLCIITFVALFILILLSAYAVRKLRRDGRFLWISLNDDIGKLIKILKI